MQVHSQDAKDELSRRLRRIEGQVRGVQRMLEEERDCRELLQQLSAIRSAVQQTSMLLLRSYASECMTQAEREERTRLVEDFIDLLGKVP